MCEVALNPQSEGFTCDALILAFSGSTERSKAVCRWVSRRIQQAGAQHVEPNPQVTQPKVSNDPIVIRRERGGFVMTVKIGSKRIEFEKGKATFFRGSGTGTSAERRGSLNTRRLIESPE